MTVPPVTGTPVDLALLRTELETAGVPVPYGLGTANTFLETVHTYDAAGAVSALPSEADPVVEAHVAPPRLVEHVRTLSVDAIVRTTDDLLTEVFRLPTEARHLYRGTFSMLAIDAVSGASKDVEARLNFRQQASAAVQIGSTVVMSLIQAAAASTWSIQGGSDGSDFIVSVQGAAGRTIDWAVVGTVTLYSPEGLPPAPVP